MPQDLVLIGGGHSHAIVLKMFGMKPLPGVRLTLISDVLYATYSGMLPGHVAGFYGYDECHIDLRSLCEFAQCQILVDRAIAIDFSKNRVICQIGKPLKPFAPQSQYLGLIGTGNKIAIASRGNFMWESPLLWYWKDWIDRQFMKRFSNKN